MTAAVLLLIAEIFARAQLCCDERKLVYWALASAVLASGELITYIGELITYHIQVRRAAPRRINRRLAASACSIIIRDIHT